MLNRAALLARTLRTVGCGLAALVCAAEMAQAQQTTSLINALQSYSSDDLSYAFAPGIDINQPVVPQSNLDALLASINLQGRQTGAVLYIESASADQVEVPVITTSLPEETRPLAQATARSNVTGEVVLASTAPEPPAANTANPLKVPRAVRANEAPPALLPPIVKTDTASYKPVVPAAPPAEPMVLAPVEPQMPIAETHVAEVVPAASLQEPAPVAAPTPPPLTPVEAAVNLANDSIPLGQSVGVASAVVSPTLTQPDSWVAERGETLRATLEKWCQRANVQMVWSSEFDYPLGASITLNDSFENAVRAMLIGLSGASPQPIARLHRQGNSGSKVLIVSTRGNTYQDR